MPTASRKPAPRPGPTIASSPGTGELDGFPVTIAVQDFAFMGGSLGMAAGEAIITAMRAAAAKKTPFIFFISSGGARMQEGVLSLMQMPRTTVAVQELRAAKLPYIVVLTHPTTGGVTASYAMLGDVQISEPAALIGFAGQRVIEQTIREKLPAGFQRAEYLQEHGMVDMVVHRHQMRETVSRIVRMLMKAPSRAAALDRTRRRRRLILGPQRRHPDAAAVAASEDHRPEPRPHAGDSGEARTSRTQAAAGHPCGRHQRQGLDRRLSPPHHGKRRASRFMPIPRRIW